MLIIFLFLQTEESPLKTAASSSFDFECQKESVIAVAKYIHSRYQRLFPPSASDTSSNQAAALQSLKPLLEAIVGQPLPSSVPIDLASSFGAVLPTNSSESIGSGSDSDELYRKGKRNDLKRDDVLSILSSS